MTANSQGSTLIPLLRYRDAPAAIEWLCRVLGAERRVVVPAPDGGIRHAQLSLGKGLIMLGSVREDPRMARPEECGNRNTQAVCVVVQDVDAVYARAKAAGAWIDLEVNDVEFGGRLCSFRDPEGHAWHVGSYDPWA